MIFVGFNTISTLYSYPTEFGNTLSLSALILTIFHYNTEQKKQKRNSTPSTTRVATMRASRKYKHGTRARENAFAQANVFVPRILRESQEPIGTKLLVLQLSLRPNPVELRSRERKLDLARGVSERRFSRLSPGLFSRAQSRAHASPPSAATSN